MNIQEKLEMESQGVELSFYFNSLQKHALPISKPNVVSCGVKSTIGNFSGSPNSS